MTRSEEYWLVIGWPIGFKDLGRNSVDRRIDFDVEQSKVTNLLLILYFLDYCVAMTSFCLDDVIELCYDDVITT